MKTIQSKRNGTIIRVSNEEAERLVKESDFKYVPKHKLKEQNK